MNDPTSEQQAAAASHRARLALAASNNGMALLGQLQMILARLPAAAHPGARALIVDIEREARL